MTLKEKRTLLNYKKNEANKISFEEVLNSTRSNAATAPSLEIITKEVEIVRAKRNKKKP